MNAITYATAQILRVLPRTQITRVMGHLADYAWPEPVGRAVVDLYCRAYDVDLDECRKASGFRSFDEFFTRELRDGARPLPEDPGVVISPADGRVDSIGPVDGRAFRVKGRPYQVDELLGDEAEARRYEGGQGCVVYLSPRDYHRVHAPVAGEIAVVRSMPGDYYPVNAIGVRHVHNLFVRNRRVAIAIDTPPESGLGRVTVVMVAAMVVGRITVSGIDERDVPIGTHELSPRRKVERGEEIGIFRLGSTAVVFFEPGVVSRWLAGEGAVRFGQPFALHAREKEAGKEATNGSTVRGAG
ncbi:MAG: phosphatidylserine decarboxylase [Myxococcales bacterium 68-20]|mgnify:CR=1 FL=1|nr:MAG: phosphatidylserine decarboxylase [Myxococcales bacterium 68-20]